MTTQLGRPGERADETPPQGTGRGPDRSTMWWALAGCAAAVALILVAHNARRGAVAQRIKNAAVQGARGQRPALRCEYHARHRR